MHTRHSTSDSAGITTVTTQGAAGDSTPVGSVAAALQIAHAAIRRHVVVPEHLRTVTAALNALDVPGTAAPPHRPFLAVQLPLVLCGGLTGDEHVAVPLAAVALHFWIALGLAGPTPAPMRSHDGDAGASGTPPTGGDDIASTCGALAHLLVAELDVTPPVQLALHRALAYGWLRVVAARARYAALLTAGRLATFPVDAAELESVITGAQAEAGATLGELVARLAGAPADVAAIYADLGRVYCAADQVQRECDAWLGAGAGAGAGADDTAARTCVPLLQVYRQRALLLLDEAEPRQPARTQLEQMLDGYVLRCQSAPA